MEHQTEAELSPIGLWAMTQSACLLRNHPVPCRLLPPYLFPFIPHFLEMLSSCHLSSCPAHFSACSSPIFSAFSSSSFFTLKKKLNFLTVLFQLLWMLIFLNPPLNVGVSGAELIGLHVCLLWFFPSLMHSFVFSYHPFIDDSKYIFVPRPVFWILDLCTQTVCLTSVIFNSRDSNQNSWRPLQKLLHL